MSDTDPNAAKGGLEYQVGVLPPPTESPVV